MFVFARGMETISLYADQGVWLSNKQTKASVRRLILGFEILNTTIQRFSIVFALTAFETIQIGEKTSGHYRAHCLVLSIWFTLSLWKACVMRWNRNCKNKVKSSPFHVVLAKKRIIQTFNTEKSEKNQTSRAHRSKIHIKIALPNFLMGIWSPLRSHIQKRKPKHEASLNQQYNNKSNQPSSSKSKWNPKGAGRKRHEFQSQELFGWVRENNSKLQMAWDQIP